jgi:transcription antitermination protein NusB
MGFRRKARVIALQFLYGHDFTGAPDEISAVEREFEQFCASFDAGRQALPYARQLITGICMHREEIDRLLAAHSHNWRLERMSLVDRNILRIALFEMKHCEDVPNSVAMNEALEIAKQYSMPDSVSFINGLLDAMQAES